MAEKITPSTAAREAASAFIRGNGPWKEAEINLPDDDYAVQAFARFERRTLEALRTNFCPNCETQANTIEELRTANERWVIAFKQAAAEERAKIVAWLREQVEPKEMLLFNQTAWVLADCIEAREHETFAHPDNV